ncbi:hypothetical protein HYC85_027782 [Camellia sinensis]|uniref:Glabrous enhancer-binding protein-like DBD domain-containing protein n=1 Tax=Camellia sinensis TaxID=4442 RepID=A0A7J7FUB8_CAMSI|nr:hypothetical protein HYC85_027782 [Camellia sinensis]
MNAFFLFIKNPIHVYDTKTQLPDKVCKLKNKYKTNAIKAKLPSNPHDQQLYDLSQKIWDFQTNVDIRASFTSSKPISNPTLKCPVVESKNRELKRAKAVKVKVNADGVEDTLNKTTTDTTCTTSVSKNGILDYTATKGADPSAYMYAFFLFVKDSIHVNDTKTQLFDKVRKLKNKYKTNAIKAKLPSNPRNQQLYDLSQTIWDFQTNAAKLDTTNNNKDVVHGKPILKEGALNKMFSSISLKIPDRLGQIIELLVTGIGGQFSFDGIGLIVLGDGFLLLKKIANVAND